MATNPPGTRTLLGITYKPTTAIYVMILLATLLLCTTYMGYLTERQGVFGLVVLSLAIRLLGKR